MMHDPSVLLPRCVPLGKGGLTFGSLSPPFFGMTLLSGGQFTTDWAVGLGSVLLQQPPTATSTI